MSKRIFLIVLDSFGIGEAPDAAVFGDEGANTLKSVYQKMHVPNLQRLGLFNIDGINFGEKISEPIGLYGRLHEASHGKDTTIGHWEIAGIISEKPLPTYPNGFPEETIIQLEQAIGRKIICNMTYSGTQVIRDFGLEHQQTGALIVYTSADSVMQIAAHEDIVPVDTLYKYCKKARVITNVGRVIARPFTGTYPNYVRISRRHDFSLQPPAETLLDKLKLKGHDVIGVGKIADIFANRGLTRSLGINESNTDGMNKTLKLMDENFNGLCFVNLVDFDMIYGHRRSIEGYAQALTDFDVQLGLMIKKMSINDTLILTADHGCDPAFKGTDHTREDVPLLIYDNVQCGNLGTKDSFTVIANFILNCF